MILHHWQHSIRMYIFSEVTCFSKTVLIYLNYFHMVYQSTSSSEYLFFLFCQAFLLFNFIIITHQLLNYFSTWFPFLLSFESSGRLHLVTKFLAFSCRFLDTVNSGCRLHDKTHRWFSLHKIYKQIQLKNGNSVIA